VGPPVMTRKGPLTLSLSRKGRGNGAARYGFEINARSVQQRTLSPPYPLADMASLSGKLAKASLRGRGWPQSGRVRGKANIPRGGSAAKLRRNRAQESPQP
jgi:hypothetical protein